LTAQQIEKSQRDILRQKRKNARIAITQTENWAEITVEKKRLQNCLRRKILRVNFLVSQPAIHKFNAKGGLYLVK